MGIGRSLPNNYDVTAVPQVDWHQNGLEPNLACTELKIMVVIEKRLSLEANFLSGN